MFIAGKGLLLCSLAVFIQSCLSDGEEIPSPNYLFKLLEEHRFEEFQKYTNIRIPEKNEVLQGGSRSDVMIQSDMLQTTEQWEKARQGIRFENHPSYRWPGSPAIVPYIIDPSYPKTELAVVQEAIDEWNAKNPCVQFTPLENETESSYVMFYYGDYCGAYLGRHDSPQQIFVSEDCGMKGDLLHAMEHTIGMIHEHSRPDRDEYVEVLYENIHWFFRPDYYRGHEDSFNSLLEYDYYSLMHYPYLAPFSDKPAFKILKEDVDTSKMGLMEGFTDLDIKKIAALYC